MVILPPNELGHHHLVHGRFRVLHTGRRPWACLVATTGSAGQFVLFTDGGGYRGPGRYRVVGDSGDDAGRIRQGFVVGPFAFLAGDRVARRICATLSAGWPTMAGVDSLRVADAGADPQFFPLAEYQLPRDHRPAASPISRRIRLGPRGCSQSLMLVGQLGSLVFIIFVADATFAVWGKGDSFDKAIAVFAKAYADQTNATMQASKKVVSSGQVEVVMEPE